MSVIEKVFRKNVQATFLQRTSFSHDYDDEEEYEHVEFDDHSLLSGVIQPDFLNYLQKYY